MGALRKTLRVVLWVIGIVIALPVIAILAVFAINVRDRSPSPEAQALEAQLRDMPPVVDAENAYVFLLGYSAPRDQSPVAVGAERAAWLRAMREDASLTPASDPHPPSVNTFAQFNEQIVGLNCDADEACDAKLAEAREQVRAVLASQPWVLERYRRLLAYRKWAEVTSADLRTPLPDFISPTQTRTLYFLDAWSDADAGDAEAVRNALDADLEFWRLVLRESGSLLSKEIAEGFIRRHFRWGNLILRRLPPDVRAQGIPLSWRSPLTDDERSMARALRGEWEFRWRSMQHEKASPHLFLPDKGQPYRPPVADRINTALSMRLMQPQASANRFAADVLRLDALLDVPYTELAQSLRGATTIDEPRTGIGAVYNLVGNILVNGHEVLADYGVRVADLEGVRRAALLTAELRARGVPADRVLGALALEEARNPYTGEAFQWNVTTSSVGFTGLQSTNRYTEFAY